MVVHRCLEDDPGLLLRKSWAYRYFDCKHTSIQLRHRTSKVGQSPDEGIVVRKINVHRHTVVLLVLLGEMLDFPIQIRCQTRLLLHLYLTLLGPIVGLVLQCLLDHDQPPPQLGIVEDAIHTVGLPLEWHRLELLINCNLLLGLVNALNVGVIIPQESALAKVLEGFKDGLRIVHVLVVLCANAWLYIERRRFVHRSVFVDAEKFFETLYDRQPQCFVSYLLK